MPLSMNTRSTEQENTQEIFKLTFQRKAVKIIVPWLLSLLGTSGDRDCKFVCKKN